MLLNVVLLIIGCFMEALAARLILIPILAPAAASYGIDPVQFGVMVVLNLIIGTLTPPLGVVLFVVTRIAEIRFEVWPAPSCRGWCRCWWCWRRSRCIRR